MAHAWDPSTLERLRQDNCHESEASLAYTVRLCQNKTELSQMGRVITNPQRAAVGHRRSCQGHLSPIRWLMSQPMATGLPLCPSLMGVLGGGHQGKGLLPVLLES